MIICAQCGERNADGTVFCDRCGAFLEWEGERIADPAEGQAGDGGQQVPGASTSEGAGDRSVPAAHHAAAGAGGPADRVGTTTATASAGTATTPTGGGIGGATGAGTGTGGGAAGAGAGEDVGGGARQPERMRRRRASQRRHVPRNVPTGSLICGSCAMPNQSERRFCARCGHPLADARVVRKAPWWRRLIGRERIYEAGHRRKAPVQPGRRMRRVRRIAMALLLIAGIGGVGILAGPQRGLVMKAFSAVQNLVMKPEQVRPTEQHASITAKGHPAAHAFDGATNTFWAAPRGRIKANSVPWLRAEFDQPIHLVAVGITPGMSLDTPKFVAGTRPVQIEVSATVASGEPVRKRFDLDDSAGFQRLSMSARDVRSIQVSILASKGKLQTMRTAITEVEFFARR